MPTYISLLRFTDKGASHIKKSPTRAAAFAAAAKKAGVKIEAQYWTAGAYDGVIILSAATEAKALHCLTELTAAGNVRPETLQAFDSKSFAAITRGK